VPLDRGGRPRQHRHRAVHGACSTARWDRSRTPWSSACRWSLLARAVGRRRAETLLRRVTSHPSIAPPSAARPGPSAGMSSSTRSAGFRSDPISPCVLASASPARSSAVPARAGPHRVRRRHRSDHRALLHVDPDAAMIGPLPAGSASPRRPSSAAGARGVPAPTPRGGHRVPLLDLWLPLLAGALGGLAPLARVSSNAVADSRSSRVRVPALE